MINLFKYRYRYYFFTATGIYYLFKTIHPGVVATEMPRNPLAPTLKSEDIADAVVYVLSTPPSVSVNNQQN